MEPTESSRCAQWVISKGIHNIRPLQAGNNDKQDRKKRQPQTKESSVSFESKTTSVESGETSVIHSQAVLFADLLERRIFKEAPNLKELAA